MLLTGFEKKNGHLAQIEVDKVFSLMCHLTTYVSPNDAMPGGVVLVKLLLNIEHNVLLCVMFFQCLSNILHQVLLYLLRYFSIFDNNFQLHRAGQLQWSPGGGAGDGQIQQKVLPLKSWHISIIPFLMNSKSIIWNSILGVIFHHIYSSSLHSRRDYTSVWIIWVENFRDYLWILPDIISNFRSHRNKLLSSVKQVIKEKITFYSTIPHILSECVHCNE